MRVEASIEQQRCMSHIVRGTTIQQSCSTTETSGISVLPGMTINGETVNIFFNQISSQSAFEYESSATWYKNQPVGKVTFMKSMAEHAGLEGCKTNHSARKTN